MRLHILSDLHQEFALLDLPAPDCDAVILAGDINTRTNGLLWARRQYPDQPIVYICGNHEYYGDKLPKLTHRMREDAAALDIHFLENDFITLGGLQIFGCTLWTDMALTGDPVASAKTAGEMMNDYARIRHSGRAWRKLRPADTMAEHRRSREALETFFAQSPGAPKMVMSHHAPSVRSLPERRYGTQLSPAYASRLDSLIETWQPLLWVHGHIHHSNDYTIGRTRILSNPRAYPDEPNPDYEPELIVTLPVEAAEEACRAP